MESKITKESLRQSGKTNLNTLLMELELQKLTGCWYCGEKDHADTPCIHRVEDANRFVEQGKEIYGEKSTN